MIISTNYFFCFINYVKFIWKNLPLYAKIKKTSLTRCNLDQLENDQPFSNGNYNNGCGEEINSIPSNETGEEINDAVLISQRSKKIAKAITSTVVLFAIIALFAPAFSRVCSRIKGVDYKKLFVCEVSDFAVYDSNMEFSLHFSCLDQKTQAVVDGEINLEDYGEDIIIVLSNKNEKYEKTITKDIINNEYTAVFQGLETNTEYTLTVKIGKDTIFEEKYSILISEGQLPQN